MSLLLGKKILVTGASSGIGRSVCHEIHQQDGAVIGVARDKGRLKSAFQSLGGDRNSFRSFDVANFEGYAEFVKTLEPLDGLVHSAGTPSLLPLRNVRKSDLDETLHVLLYAPILFTLELLRSKKLKEGASVVFLSSSAALAQRKAQMPYAIAKSSLLIAARCMTHELSSRYKIRFNAVMPGLVKSPVLQEIERMVGAEKLQQAINEYPLGLGRPQDVASLISFLLSDRSRWISGSSFLIDGGRLCR